MTDDETLAVRQHLAVLERRIRFLKAKVPTLAPSQKSLYILKFPRLTNTAGTAGRDAAVTVRATLGSDAAFVAQAIALVGYAPALPGAEGGPDAVPGNLPFFDIVDRASGGRSLFNSQEGNTLTNRFPVTHFANTLPAATRGASYSLFTLPSEYLLAKGSAVEARLFRDMSQQCDIEVALCGYKVFG